MLPPHPEPPDWRLTALDFMRTELGLADTFLGIAYSHPDDEEVNKRNRQNARAAYETILRFLPRLKLSAMEQDEFDSGLGALKVQLLDLGEVFA